MTTTESISFDLGAGECLLWSGKRVFDLLREAQQGESVRTPA